MEEYIYVKRLRLFLAEKEKKHTETVMFEK